VDPRNGGTLTLDNLQAAHGRFHTTEVITGSGGTHFYFSHAFTASKGTHALGQGIDLKTDGGYVVAPPSIHPNGKPYEWEASGDEPTNSPAWVVTFAPEDGTGTVMSYQIRMISLC
jgi:Bifunctional DNA primase/polymerase, N-terminal